MPTRAPRVPPQAPLPAADPASVLVVEGDDAVRAEVAIFLETPPVEISVTACADVESALRALASGVAPDAVVVDLGLDGGRGADVIHHVRRERPRCPVIVFTHEEDDDALFDALRAGACGYLLKPTPPERIHEALLESLAGGAPMSPGIARRVVASFLAEGDPRGRLSNREREVLALLARGHTYGDIAAALEIGLGTMQGYVKTLYRKLEVSSKAEAAAYAQRLGLA